MVKKQRIERRKTMENMGNKKLALLYILQILQKESDADHPLTQQDLIEKLERDYGIVLERKAISRNLSLLREAGYEVESTAKGVFLDESEFDATELRLLIDSVLASRYVTEKQAKNLADRIAGLSNKFFRSRTKHVHVLADHAKTENNTVFYNVDIFDEAIEAGLQVSFDYYDFNENLKLEKHERVTVSPIQMVVKNQFYYLIAVDEWKIFGSWGRQFGGPGKHQIVIPFRMDLISNPIIEDTKIQIDEDEIRKSRQESDPRKFLETHPFMHSWGKPTERASFLCYKYFLGTVIENLGTDLRAELVPNQEKTNIKGRELVRVTLKINLHELVTFACSHPEAVFLESPAKAAYLQSEKYKTHLQTLEKIKKYMI